MIITYLPLKCLHVSSYYMKPEKSLLRQIVFQGKSTIVHWCDLLENHLVTLTMLTQKLNIKTSIGRKISPLANLAAVVCSGYQSNASQKKIYKERRKNDKILKKRKPISK